MSPCGPIGWNPHSLGRYPRPFVLSLSSRKTSIVCAPCKQETRPFCSAFTLDNNRFRGGQVHNRKKRRAGWDGESKGKGGGGRGRWTGKLVPLSQREEAWELLLSSSHLLPCGNVGPVLPDLLIFFFPEKPEIWNFMRNLPIFKSWQLIQNIFKTLCGPKEKKKKISAS